MMKMLPFFLALFCWQIAPNHCLPALTKDSQHVREQLRVIDRTSVFDPGFLQQALRGRIPGVDLRFVLDLAYWFHHKSIPCCEQILTEMGTRHLYNCTQLPDPTDHSSTQFLHRMLFECIGERRNASDCCYARGVHSEKCLRLCDAGNPAISTDALEGADDGSGFSLMDHCAAEQRVPKPQLLWMLFDCLNPEFSKVMRLTQAMKAEEERQRLWQKQRGERRVA